MEKAEIIKIDGAQLVQLPKDFNIQGDEILIRRRGNVITLMTKEEAWKILDEALNGFTDDFMPNGREPQTYIK